MAGAAVTLVLVNGRLRTGDPRRAMADALAVAGDVLALVGSSAEVRKLGDAATRVLDVRGATVGPATAGGVLRRGEPASFVVRASAADDAAELFRMEHGVILHDHHA